MSLDLSATLLVTELAPVPPLIQRLGRLNRRAREADVTCPFIVIDVNDCLPYTADGLQLAREWLAALPKGPLSQRDLAQAWEQQQSEEQIEFVPSAWLDGGPRTEVRELREASPGITVVLHDDVAAIRSGSSKLVEVALPMPPPAKSVNWREWDTIRGVPIAPTDAIDYDPLRGAAWRKK
jgi:CRISPR-associated endonuclease/helicase Cas3